MYDQNNIFAKIIRGEIPCKQVFRDDKVLAFFDINPQAKIHVLVLPVGEYISFSDFIAKASPQDVTYFFAKIKDITDSLKLNETGYRLISNHGTDAKQSVEHFHVHILGGENLGDLLVS